jgi:hypothetical protein
MDNIQLQEFLRQDSPESAKWIVDKTVSSSHVKYQFRVKGIDASCSFWHQLEWTEFVTWKVFLQEVQILFILSVQVQRNAFGDPFPSQSVNDFHTCKGIPCNIIIWIIWPLQMINEVIWHW